MSRKKLNGNRNQCAACGKYFNSNGAFDKHRTGQHGVDRRCMTTDEMLEQGMVLGEDEFWRGSAMPESVYSSQS
jgi:hypothetical protein